LPTPLHKLEELSRTLKTDIWIKRDDLTGFALGGTKARKAEFLMADALEKRCDVILTEGPIQSNHTRVIAAAAQRYSKECHLFLSGQKPERPTANLMLDLLADAKIHVVTYEARSAAMEAFAQEIRKLGRRPYVIPVGGGNEIGAQGDVLCFDELETQLQDLEQKPTVLVLATSNGGTHAGILVGKALTGSTVNVLGVGVGSRDAHVEDSICALANAVAKALNLSRQFKREDVNLNSDYVGEGYDIPTDESIRALKELWKRDGVLLDPTYTAKAMAGLIDLARKGEWTNERVVFLHTGGTPSVFSSTTTL
jgi:D-cysteine desulfhydrase family pyridoxal phosphate-dependent enzyme